MTHKNTTGVWGEQAACRFLVSRGYRIVATNWRAGHGEIDIIANFQGTTVFVEVKARLSDAFGTPEEAITPHKQRILRATISAFLASHKVSRFRVDVIAIAPHGQKRMLRHLKDVELAG